MDAGIQACVENAGVNTSSNKGNGQAQIQGRMSFREHLCFTSCLKQGNKDMLYGSPPRPKVGALYLYLAK